MVNKPKNKGTAAETLVVNHLIQAGFTEAHRSALSGSLDIGDILGLTNLTIQVKSHKTPHVPQWLRATEEQRVRSGNVFSVLVAKRSGSGARNVGNWYAITLDSKWKGLYYHAHKVDPVLTSNLNFIRVGKQISSALAVTTGPRDVVVQDFSKGIEISGDLTYRIMSLDGFLGLYSKAMGVSV